MKRKHIDYFDFLRGLAIIFVVFNHSYSADPMSDRHDILANKTDSDLCCTDFFGSICILSFKKELCKQKRILLLS